MKKRSGFTVMVRLIGLVKQLSGYMVLAILMGLVGHLCAAFITIFGGFAVLDLLGFSASVTLKTTFVCVLLFALVRGIFRYAEQSCNHFIAFKLLALIRDKVFRALRRLCPAKLEGRDCGDLISVITSRRSGDTGMRFRGVGRAVGLRDRQPARPERDHSVRSGRRAPRRDGCAHRCAIQRGSQAQSSHGPEHGHHEHGHFALRPCNAGFFRGAGAARRADVRRGAHCGPCAVLVVRPHGRAGKSRCDVAKHLCREQPRTRHSG